MALPSSLGTRCTKFTLFSYCLKIIDSVSLNTSGVNCLKVVLLRILEYLKLGLSWRESTCYIRSANMAAFPKRHGASEGEPGGLQVKQSLCDPVAGPQTCLFLSLPHSHLWPASDFGQKGLRVRPVLNRWLCELFPNLAVLPITLCGLVQISKISPDSPVHAAHSSDYWQEAVTGQPSGSLEVLGGPLSSSPRVRRSQQEAEEASVILFPGSNTSFCSLRCGDNSPVSLKDGDQGLSLLLSPPSKAKGSCPCIQEVLRRQWKHLPSWHMWHTHNRPLEP